MAASKREASKPPGGSIWLNQRSSKGDRISQPECSQHRPPPLLEDGFSVHAIQQRLNAYTILLPPKRMGNCGGMSMSQAQQTCKGSAVALCSVRLSWGQRFILCRSNKTPAPLSHRRQARSRIKFQHSTRFRRMANSSKPHLFLAMFHFPYLTTICIIVVSRHERARSASSTLRRPSLGAKRRAFHFYG
jgi:hypothetical protein